MSNMGQKRVKKGSNQEKDSITIKVTFDKSIWTMIDNSPELGEGDSAKVRNICVSWLSENGILPGIIKKRLKIE